MVIKTYSCHSILHFLVDVNQCLEPISPKFRNLKMVVNEPHPRSTLSPPPGVIKVSFGTAFEV